MSEIAYHIQQSARNALRIQGQMQQLTAVRSSILYAPADGKIAKQRTRSTSAQGRVGETKRPVGLEFAEDGLAQGDH